MACIHPDSVDKIIQELARLQVESGLRTAEEVTKAVHELVSPHLPDITEREVGDIYSGYGQTKQMSQEPVAVALRDVKAQRQVISAIEDASGGLRPSKTGLQRDKPSDRQRELKRNLVRTLKENGIQIDSTASLEDMMKSAQDALKTRLRNSVRDLDKQIGSGEPLPAKRKIDLVYDDETVALMAERDMLRRQATDPTAKNKESLSARLSEINKKLASGDIERQDRGFPPEIYDDAESKAMRAELKDKQRQLAAARAVPEQTTKLTEQIADLHRRIRERDFSQAEKRVKGPVDPGVQALRDQRDLLKRTLAELQGPKTRTDAERLASLKAGMERSQAKLEKDLATLKSGKLPEKVKKPEEVALDDEARVARRNLAVLQRQVHEEYNKVEWANKTRTQKALAYGSAGMRAGILSGTQVIGKIGSALGQRMVTSPVEDVVGGAVAKLPGVGKIAAKAPRHGAGFNAAAEVEAVKGAVEGAKAIPQLLKTGDTDISLEHGHAYPKIPTKVGTALAVPGRVHAAEKNILKTAEYRKSIERRLQHAERQGKNRNDPTLVADVKEAAYRDAEEIILMGDNAFTQGMQRMESGWSDSAKSISRMIVPIRRVPSNYLGQMIGEYMAGSFRGAVRVLKARNPEILEQMTAEEADKTMRLLKRGVVGLFTMGAATAVGGTVLGGYYAGKRKPDDLKPGEARIPGTNVRIPHFLLHSPPMELAQAVATVMRELGKTAERNRDPTKRPEDTSTGALRAAGAISKGIAEQTPFVREIADWMDAAHGPDKMGKFLGEVVASRVEPQIMRELAKVTDREQARQPKGFVDELRMGVPGERQKVGVKATGFGGDLGKHFGEVGFTVAQLRRKVTESDDAYKARTQADRQALEEGLGEIVQTDEYKGMDKSEKLPALRWAEQHIRHQQAEADLSDEDKDERTEKRSRSKERHQRLLEQAGMDQ